MSELPAFFIDDEDRAELAHAVIGAFEIMSKLGEQGELIMMLALRLLIEARGSDRARDKRLQGQVDELLPVFRAYLQGRKKSA